LRRSTRFFQIAGDAARRLLQLHIITLDRDLSDHLAPAQVNIGALTREELNETVNRPARQARHDVAPPNETIYT